MKENWNHLSGKPSWPVVGVIFFLASCANADADISNVQADESIPAQVVINGTFRYSERGEILHELHAGELSRQEKGNATSPEDYVEVRNGFELFIEGNETSHTARLTADWASLDEKNLRLIAKHGVILENLAGDVLETEYLVWSEDSNRVWTNRPVTIRTSDGVLYGEGLESDARFETYRILKPRGEIVLEGTENL
jgi:LPS export ABC transporter protein LptC